jgi:hypothetical protein
VKGAVAIDNLRLGGKKLSQYMRVTAILFFCAAAAVGHAADWSLRIVPLPGKPLPSVIHIGDTAPVFQVLMENTSGRPLLIWNEESSFGYFNLHYRITRSNGQAFELRRTGGSWTWNVLAGKGVLPNAVVTWDGNFGIGSAGSPWGGFPADWKDGEKVSLQAIYENISDPIEVKLYRIVAERQRAKINRNPRYDKKTRATALALAQAGSMLKFYLQGWTGKFLSPPVEVAFDHASSPSPH